MVTTNSKSILFLVIGSVLLVPLLLVSQNKFVKTGSFYFSWGYNTELYTPSNIHVKQPELNNDYTFNNIAGHDKIGWDKLLQNQLTIPQYNYRIGYFFNEKQDLAFELNFDHTKFVVAQGQSARVSGKINGRTVDTMIHIGYNTLEYQLNNGANFFLFNIVKKVNLYDASDGKINICALGKFGVGPLVPHVQNRIFGNDNVPHFQLGGWNTGVETTIKATFHKHVYLEFCTKLDYARYFNLQVYKGTVSQSFLCYELILNLGYTFQLNKNKSVTQ